MARKSYQQGKVVTRKYKYGTAFILRYRVRQPDGSWIEKSETLRDCKDKKTAQRRLGERLGRINSKNGAGAEPISASRTFADIVGSPWMHYLDNGDVKPSTRYSYDSCLRNWILPFFGGWDLVDITPLIVGEFMGLLSSRGLARKYRRNIYGLLKIIFDVAVENELLGETPIRPKLHRPKLASEEKASLSTDQARDLLQAVDSHWRVPVWTLALTGLRSGELLGLRWQNVDFLRKRIKVTHSLWRGRLVQPKTQASQAELAMSDLLLRTLVEHRQVSEFTDPENFVFCQGDGRPLDPDSLRRSGIYPAMRKAGVPYTKRASGTHAFRHLAASIIHQQTGSLKLAQKQLRHANLAITSEVYTHVWDADLEKTASVLQQALGSSVVEMW